MCFFTKKARRRDRCLIVHRNLYRATSRKLYRNLSRTSCRILSKCRSHSCSSWKSIHVCRDLYGTSHRTFVLEIRPESCAEFSWAAVAIPARVTKERACKLPSALCKRARLERWRSVWGDAVSGKYPLGQAAESRLASTRIARCWWGCDAALLHKSGAGNDLRDGPCMGGAPFSCAPYVRSRRVACSTCFPPLLFQCVSMLVYVSSSFHILLSSCVLCFIPCFIDFQAILKTNTCVCSPKKHAEGIGV